MSAGNDTMSLVFSAASKAAGSLPFSMSGLSDEELINSPSSDGSDCQLFQSVNTLKLASARPVEQRRVEPELPTDIQIGHWMREAKRKNAGKKLTTYWGETIDQPSRA